jgi:hypothetical protein
MGTWGVIFSVIIGALTGAGAIWVWQRLDQQKTKTA